MLRHILSIIAPLVGLQTPQTQLRDAILNHNTAQIREIIAQDINIDHKLPNTGGKTPLMVAAITKDFVTLNILLNHKANPNIQTKAGNTALMFLAQLQDIPNMKLLIDHGADILLTNKRGLSALNYLDEDLKEEIENYSRKKVFHV